MIWWQIFQIYATRSTYFPRPHCLKITQNVALDFSILAFSTNFCHIKVDLSGNSVGLQLCFARKLNETFSVIFKHRVLIILRRNCKSWELLLKIFYSNIAAREKVEEAIMFSNKTNSKIFHNLQKLKRFKTCVILLFS